LETLKNLSQGLNNLKPVWEEIQSLRKTEKELTREISEINEKLETVKKSETENSTHLGEVEKEESEIQKMVTSVIETIVRNFEESLEMNEEISKSQSQLNLKFQNVNVDDVSRDYTIAQNKARALALKIDALRNENTTVRDEEHKLKDNIMKLKQHLFTSNNSQAEIKTLVEKKKELDQMNEMLLKEISEAKEKSTGIALQLKDSLDNKKEILQQGKKKETEEKKKLVNF